MQRSAFAGMTNGLEPLSYSSGLDASFLIRAGVRHRFESGRLDGIPVRRGYPSGVVRVLAITSRRRRESGSSWLISRLSLTSPPRVSMAWTGIFYLVCRSRRLVDRHVAAGDGRRARLSSASTDMGATARETTRSNCSRISGRRAILFRASMTRFQAGQRKRVDQRGSRNCTFLFGGIQQCSGHAWKSNLDWDAGKSGPASDIDKPALLQIVGLDDGRE